MTNVIFKRVSLFLNVLGCVFLSVNRRF